jgi:hypothetical protein
MLLVAAPMVPEIVADAFSDTEPCERVNVSESEKPSRVVVSVCEGRERLSEPLLGEINRESDSVADSRRVAESMEPEEDVVPVPAHDTVPPVSVSERVARVAAAVPEHDRDSDAVIDANPRVELFENECVGLFPDSVLRLLDGVQETSAVSVLVFVSSMVCVRQLGLRFERLSERLTVTDTVRDRVWRLAANESLWVTETVWLLLPHVTEVDGRILADLEPEARPIDTVDELDREKDALVVAWVSVFVAEQVSDEVPGKVAEGDLEMSFESEVESVAAQAQKQRKASSTTKNGSIFVKRQKKKKSKLLV